MQDQPTPDSPSGSDAAFYQVGTEKFIELTLVTFGLFGFWWTYRHWCAINQYLQNEQQPGVQPLLRTLLSVFYQHDLYKRIAARARVEGEPVRWDPTRLFVLFVVFTLIPLWLLITEHPWGFLVNLITLLPNLLVNQSVNRVNEHHLQFYQQNTEMSGLDWALIVAGLIGWLTLLVLALTSDFS